jgi:hypothetical protein
LHVVLCHGHEAEGEKGKGDKELHGFRVVFVLLWVDYNNSI